MCLFNFIPQIAPNCVWRPDSVRTYVGVYRVPQASYIYIYIYIVGFRGEQGDRGGDRNRGQKEERKREWKKKGEGK